MYNIVFEIASDAVVELPKYNTDTFALLDEVSTLKEALLFTALTWGLIFLLGVLTKVLNHGEELVRAEEEKKGAGKDE